MSAETRERDERRPGGRRSGFWRGVLVTLAVLFGLGALGWWFGGDRPRGPHVAYLEVSGFLVDDPERAAALREIRETEAARALYLDINSPGGTTVGAEALYELVREIGETRPVVAVLGEVAASGGYIAALAADHVVARGNTMTGSIGVIVEYPDVTDLLDRLGVEVETVRSSPLKAEPAPYREAGPRAREVQEALVEDAYDWFRGLVRERRGLEGAALAEVTDGRVFTGRMALEAGLIDEIGGRDAARDWLAAQDPALADLPLGRWTPEEPIGGLVPFVARLAGGLGGIAERTAAPAPRLLSILN